MPDARADSPEKRANALYNEGKALLAKGETRAAADKFTQAWTVFRHPLIIKRRAEARERLFEIEGAISDYKIYLGVLGRRKRAERKTVEARIAELEASLARPVAVTVVASRAGVLVSVDDEPAQRTPYKLELPPGTYTVSVRDPRFADNVLESRVPPKSPFLIKIDVQPRTGTVVIGTDRGDFEGVQVAVDSEALTIADPSKEALEPREMEVGKHTLICTLPGRPSSYAEFSVVESQTVEIRCEFSAAGFNPAADPLGWTVAGAGIVSLGAGVGVLISYSSDVARAQELNTDTNPDNDVDLVTNKDIFGGVFVGVGVALGVASYFVFTRDRASASAFVLPRRGGALVGGIVRF